MESHIRTRLLTLELIERAPGTEVCPAKVDGKHHDVVCLLQDSVVNRDIGALREDLADTALLLIGSISTLHLVEDRGQRRQVLVEGIEDGMYVPSEHPTIPEEFPTLIEDLRHLDVGLFREGLHLHKVLIFNISELDVAIARLRT